jgi:hypothetical protein
VTASRPVEQAEPGAAPAPWTCRLRALLRLGFRQGHATALAVVAYADTPVGAYGEALSAELRLPLRVTVPWIVVDSAASAAAGRHNWGLPKDLASLAIDLDGLHATVRSTGKPEDLRISARVAGPRVPVLAVARLCQPGHDPAPVLFHGRARAALVAAEGPRAGGGRGPGLLLDGTLRLGAPGQSWVRASRRS